MGLIGNLTAGLRALMGRTRVEGEMDEELRGFMNASVEDKKRAGMTPEEAARAARVEMGSMETVKEGIRSTGWEYGVETVWHDVRYGVRQLCKHMGFTTATVLTLGLGIGANLAIFLIAYSVFMRPLPFPHPERVVRIERSYGGDHLEQAYSGTTALFLRRTNRTLEATAAYDFIPSNANIVESNGTIPLKLLGVTPDFFRVFAMEPVLGRGFNAQDGVPNSSLVAVISYSLWQEQFSADPHIVGRAITIGSQLYTVVGVASPLFRLDSKVDTWIPLQITEAPTDQSNEYNVVARLRPRVTRGQAEDDLKRVLLELKDAYPAFWDKDSSIRAVDYQESLVGSLRPMLEMLMGVVGLVLLIVAANILSLLLTRSIARRHEMSLRAALGASSWRILRQLLVENSILSLGGGVAGVLFAKFTAPVLMQLSPVVLPQFSSLDVGGPVLGFAAALTAVCALIFSLIPAIEVRRSRLNGSLRIDTRQIAMGDHLVQKGLVIGEVAISLVLMVGAALLLTNFWKLIHAPAGFETANVVTFKNAFSDKQVETSALLDQRLAELTARIETLPGVESAAAVNDLPTQLVPSMDFEIIGRPAGESASLGDPDYIPITQHYFNVLRVPTVAGRTFTESDTNGSVKVVVINQTFARRAFKNQSPIGQQVRIGDTTDPHYKDGIREIVGVVGDVRQEGLGAEAPSIFYLPAAQIPDAMTQASSRLLGTSWVVRTRSAQTDVIPAIQRIFFENAHVPLLDVEPLDRVISASVAQQRFSLVLLGGFGLIALALGGTGLYGVMSYGVARRTKEIGVRIAVGAQRRDIRWMVLREAGLLVEIGLIVGVVLSLAGTRLLHSQISFPNVPIVLPLIVMCGVLMLTGLLSTWWPALRAASIEPMEALRSE
jgi:predicted permease